MSESPLSHQVGADVLPFREAFAVLFFVSVGMLVDPGYLVAQAGPVLALTALIVFGKALSRSPSACSWDSPCARGWWWPRASARSASSPSSSDRRA